MASKIAFHPLLKTAYWTVGLSTALYFAMLGVLMHPVLQNHAFYLHRAQITWFKDLNVPELFGFLHNQVTPFQIKTPDGESLYSWHILPLELYRKHEEELVHAPTGFAEDFTATLPFKLLRDDPEARLVLYLHGTAGTVAQGWRPDNYRTLYSAEPSKIHVVTMDYRGFGRSTGFPTEDGLIKDAVAMVDWALNVAKIPSERIAIVGQSLGTAVSIGLAEHFAKREPAVTFAGIVLIASFSDVPTLLGTYKMGGYIPILSPLNRYPRLKAFFDKFINNTWTSKDRIATLIQKSPRYHITMIHAEDDIEIPWIHTEVLFYHAVNATLSGPVTFKEVNEAKTKTSLGEGGWLTEFQTQKGLIREEILKYGGHNRLVAYPVIAIAVQRAFQSVDPTFAGLQ